MPFFVKRKQYFVGCDQDMNIYMYNPANDVEIILYIQAFFSEVSDNIKDFYEIFHN